MPAASLAWLAPSPIPDEGCIGIDDLLALPTVAAFVMACESNSITSCMPTLDQSVRHGLLYLRTRRTTGGLRSSESAALCDGGRLVDLASFACAARALASAIATVTGSAASARPMRAAGGPVAAPGLRLHREGIPLNNTASSGFRRRCWRSQRGHRKQE